MRITRLYLRNYRVYEDPMEIELPPGLVGVFGPNGAGKSTLLEGILFALWGKARTSKDQIRTAGTNGECVAELEFEHEGHLYLVRRTITGQNHTIKAQAHADGAQMAEGVRDVGTYVHSVLGMDDGAFRASVFAEQKQLAAFSSQTPSQRRDLVMQLLGITPLDTARDRARKEARDAADQLNRMRTLLPDRVEIGRELETALEAAAAAETAAAAAAASAERTGAVREAAEVAHRTLLDVGREYERLVDEGRTVRTRRDASAARVADLTAEVEALGGAELRRAELEVIATGLPAAERRLLLMRAVIASEEQVRAHPAPTPVAPPGAPERESEEARARLEAARVRVAETTGRLSAARATLEAARTAAERSASLSGEEDCPLCGRALDAAFEQVQQHRAVDLSGAEAAVAELEADRAGAEKAAGAAAAASGEADARLEAARTAWSTYEKASERHREAAGARAIAATALAEAGVEPAPVAELTAAVEAARAAADECNRLQGRLERKAAATAELGAERDNLAGLDSELENLRDKVRALAFEPDALSAAATAAERAVTADQAAALEAQRTAATTAAAAATVEERRKRVADAEKQHDHLAQLEDDARHLARTSELLSVFRNTVVASVGPRLSAQAAELFAELTDREYDQLKVDPDTYEIQIVDHGVAYGMDRFSGSETDLANLALRVAVSEHVRFQSGGAVGLLVLDEVFGPLDEDRKARMLLALERLRGRFRQVLVVTHDPAMKEQMPAAIEVGKLPGRRARAFVL